MLPAVIPTLAYLSYSLGIEQKAPFLWWHPLFLKKLTGLVYPFLSYNLFIDLILGMVFVTLLFLLWREMRYIAQYREVRNQKDATHGPPFTKFQPQR